VEFIEVEATDLTANRLWDLDRRKVLGGVFQDIEFVDTRYRSFDASGWPVLDSGLLGPVGLRPDVGAGGIPRASAAQPLANLEKPNAILSQ
jgi:hypothetical protein